MTPRWTGTAPPKVFRWFELDQALSDRLNAFAASWERTPSEALEWGMSEHMAVHGDEPAPSPWHGDDLVDLIARQLACGSKSSAVITAKVPEHEH
jgi:hypothetical protein